MTAISEHISNSLPRSAVYDYKIGSDLFIDKRQAVVFPDTNSQAYQFDGDSKLTFVIASPQKNVKWAFVEPKVQQVY